MRPPLGPDTTPFSLNASPSGCEICKLANLGELAYSGFIPIFQGSETSKYSVPRVMTVPRSGRRVLVLSQRRGNSEAPVGARSTPVRGMAGGGKNGARWPVKSGALSAGWRGSRKTGTSRMAGSKARPKVFAVSHPCDRRTSQGWGTEHLFLLNLTPALPWCPSAQRCVQPCRTTATRSTNRGPNLCW